MFFFSRRGIGSIVMNSQHSCQSTVSLQSVASTGSSIAEECTLNLDSGGLAELEQTEEGYFQHWYDPNGELVRDTGVESGEEDVSDSEPNDDDNTVVPPVWSSDDLKG